MGVPNTSKTLAIAIILSLIAVVTAPNIGAHRTYVTDTHDNNNEIWSGIYTKWFHESTRDVYTLISNFWNTGGHKHYWYDEPYRVPNTLELAHNSPNLWYSVAHANEHEYEMTDGWMHYLDIEPFEGRGNWPSFDSPGSFPGTVGYAGGCETGKTSDPKLAMAFMDQGSWVYMGWHNKLSLLYNVYYSIGFYFYLTLFEYNVKNAAQAAHGVVPWYAYPPGSMVIYSWKTGPGETSSEDYPIHIDYSDPFPQPYELFPNSYLNWEVDSPHTDDNGAFLFISGVSDATSQIVWQDDTPANWEIYQSPNQGGGQQRITFDSASSTNPDVAVDSMGKMHIVWADDREGDSDIFYSQLDSTGQTVIDDLNIMTSMDEADGDDQYGPVVTVGIHPVTSQEMIYVFYADQELMGFADRYVIRGMEFDGIAWRSMNRFTVSYVSTDRPIFDKANPVDAVVDDEGIIHLIYAIFADVAPYTLESLRHLQCRPKAVGRECAGSQILHEYAYERLPFNHYNAFRYPHITVEDIQDLEDTNQLHAIYSYDPAPQEIGTGYYDSHTTYVKYRGGHSTGLYGIDWSQDSYEAGTAIDAAQYSSLASDGFGFIYIVWQSWLSTGDFGLKFSHFDPKVGGWAPTEEVFNLDGSHQKEPSLDHSGDLHLLWSDDRNGNFEIYRAKGYNMNGYNYGWRSAIRVSNSAGTSRFPSSSSPETILNLNFGSEGQMYYFGPFKLENYVHTRADIWMGSYNVVVHLPDYNIRSGHAQAEIWLSSGKFMLEHAEITVIGE
jgi:hypothetical protein